MEWTQNNYRISTTKNELDIDVIHQFLTNSYWAKGISRETVAQSITGSLCFGLFQQKAQVGFARMITDETTFAYLADVFILPEHRGHGLGKWLISTVLVYPSIQGLRSIILATSDAHGLYEQFGFAPLKNPDKFMLLRRSEM